MANLPTFDRAVPAVPRLDGLTEAALPTKPSSRPREIDEAALDVGADELDAHAFADVEPRLAADDAAFDRRRDDAHPRPLVGRAGDDAVEDPADAIGEQQRRCRLADLPLDFVSSVLLLRAGAA